MKCSFNKKKKDKCINARNICFHRKFVEKIKYYRYRMLKTLHQDGVPKGYTAVSYLEKLLEESEMCVKCMEEN